MTGGTRIAVLVIAAVILVGGFLLARGSGSEDDENSSATQTTAQPAETSPQTAPSEPENPATTAPGGTTQAAPPPPRVETIRMKDKGPAGEIRTIEYDRGDTIRLRFVSNVAEEVHIHGFDKYIQVPANGSARSRFGASIEGIFEVESHGSGELLAKLKISPK